MRSDRLPMKERDNGGKFPQATRPPFRADRTCILDLEALKMA